MDATAFTLLRLRSSTLAADPHQSATTATLTAPLFLEAEAKMQEAIETYARIKAMQDTGQRLQPRKPELSVIGGFLLEGDFS